MSMSVCDKDCFHCVYPDCINDEMDPEDYKESVERDRDLRMTAKQKKEAARRKAARAAQSDKGAGAKGQKAFRVKHTVNPGKTEEQKAREKEYHAQYYLKYRERILSYVAQYRRIHREEMKQKAREYRKNHADALRAYGAAYWQKHAEEIRAKRRENRQRYALEQGKLMMHRKILGLTQTEAGELLGVSGATVKNWEKGYTPCNVEGVIFLLYAACGKTVGVI